jgi:hypothetical protein
VPVTANRIPGRWHCRCVRRHERSLRRVPSYPHARQRRRWQGVTFMGWRKRRTPRLPRWPPWLSKAARSSSRTSSATRSSQHALVVA